jgi:hypothetical protein
VCVCFGEGVTMIICVDYNIEEFCESVLSIKSKYVWDILHSGLIILKFQIALENQPL